MYSTVREAAGCVRRACRKAPLIAKITRSLNHALWIGLNTAIQMNNTQQ